MATNNFKPFATDPGANVMPQADWEVLPALLSGFMAGKASSEQVNKAIRQASFIAAALAQYTANKTGSDVLDNGDLNGFITKMSTAFGKDFQALDATLTALAGLVGAANKLAYFNGADTAALTDLTLVGRDIIGKADIASVLTYLGLKTAAQRDVGTGTNQIPDMSYFTASLATNGWAKLPNGLIIQQGVGGPLTPAVPDNVINFNISFPNRCLFITEHDIGNSAKRTMIQIGYVTPTAFTGYNLGVLDRTIPSGLQPPISATVQWFAIGY